MKGSKRKLKVATIAIYGDNMGLFEKKCIPCEGGIPPLVKEQIEAIISEINADWKVIDNHHLERTWKFDDFENALNFVNQTGEICETEGHHANYEFGWGEVKILIWTHKIDGLTDSDFILASKIDRIG